MPLNKTIIRLPIGGGVETKVDPKKIPVAKLSTLYNGRFEKVGQLSKRTGFDNNVWTDQTIDDDTIENFGSIINRKCELLLNGRQTYSDTGQLRGGDGWCFYTLDDIRDEWVLIGRGEPLELYKTIVSKPHEKHIMPDLATTNDYTCFVWTFDFGALSSVEMVLMDNKTGAIVKEHGFSPIGVKTARVVGFDGNFYIWGVKEVNGNIYMAVVDTSAYENAPSTMTLYWSDYHADNLYDVTIANDSVNGWSSVVAYKQQNTGHILVKWVDSAGVLQHTVDLGATSICKNALSVQRAQDSLYSTVFRIVVTTQDNVTDHVVYWVRDEDSASILSKQTLITSTVDETVRNITCIHDHSIVTGGIDAIYVAWYIEIESDGATPWYHYIRTAYDEIQTGAANTETDMIRNAGLASKAFHWDLKSHVWIVYDSPLQSTLFCVSARESANNDGEPADRRYDAKALSGISDGITAMHGLPRVIQADWGCETLRDEGVLELASKSYWDFDGTSDLSTVTKPVLPGSYTVMGIIESDTSGSGKDAVISIYETNLDRSFRVWVFGPGNPRHLKVSHSPNGYIENDQTINNCIYVGRRYLVALVYTFVQAGSYNRVQAVCIGDDIGVVTATSAYDQGGPLYLPGDSTTLLRVGDQKYFAENHKFEGKMYAVGIFDQALSTSQLSEIYNGDKHCSDFDPLFYLDFSSVIDNFYQSEIGDYNLNVTNGGALTQGNNPGDNFATSVLHRDRLEDDGVIIKSIAGLSLHYGGTALDRCMLGPTATVGVGGFVGDADGRFAELGFHIFPDPLDSSVAAAGGNFSDGTYYHKAVYEWTDREGQIHRSAPSSAIETVCSLGGAVQTINIEIPCIHKGEIDKLDNTTIAVYRLCSDNVYHRCVEDPITGTNRNRLNLPYITYADTATDAALLDNEVLYTEGGIVSNIAPPASRIVNVRDNRIFLVPEEDRELIWYSKIKQNGIGIEFSDIFTKRISAGGQIIALADLDGREIVFKYDSIYMFAGPGPNDLGVGSYTDVRLVSTDVGCMDRASVEKCDLGLVFKSRKGIYLLNRSLQIEYIGSSVEDWNQYRVIKSKLVQAKHQIRFLLNNGDILVYDYLVRQWSVYNVSGFDTLNSADCEMWQASCVLAHYHEKLHQETSDYVDNNADYIPLDITTGWINLGLLQGYQRLRWIALLGDFKSTHILNIEIYYDYIDTVYQTLQLTANSAFGADEPFQIRFRTDKQKCQAVKFRIYDEEPLTDAGSQQGLSLTGIELEIGAKKGIIKLGGAKTIGG